MIKKIAIIVIIVLVVAFIGYRGFEQSGQGVDSKVKIGVITIQTGPAAAYGTYTTNGIKLAMDELQSSAIELVFKDSKADPQEAVRVFKELRSAEVPLIIGPFTSDETKQVGPEAQSSGIVILTSSATADELSNIGENIFMLLPPNKKQGEDQAKYAIESLGARRAAILYGLIPYGQTMRESFSNAFKNGGGEIVADESYPVGQENFRDQLRKIAETQPDVIFIPVQDSQAGRILRQAKEVRFPEIPFLGGDGAMTETTIELAGEAAEGFIVSNIASTDPTFGTRYKEVFGEDPSPFSASAYDAVRVVNEIASSGARSATEFRTGLVNITNRKGASGTMQFSKIDKSYWCMEKSYSQFVVKDGKFTKVD